MSATLEKIVRPVETGLVSPPRKTFEGGTKRDENVKLEIGRHGAGRTFQGSSSIRTSVYLDTKINERRK